MEGLRESYPASVVARMTNTELADALNEQVFAHTEWAKAVLEEAIVRLSDLKATTE